jgi:AraC-like DNA-binding protein
MYEHRYREIKPHGMPDFPFHIYKVEHDADAHSILPIHWHNEMEIIFMANGSATFRIESREFALREGEALIIHPGELHAGDNDKGNYTCFYAIVFKLSWLSSLQSDRIDDLFLAPILKSDAKLPARLSADREADAELLNDIRQILIRFDRKSPAYEMSLKGRLLLLIADMWQYGLIVKDSGIKKQSGRASNQQIRTILSYMEDNCFEKLDLDRLSSVLSLSRTHFCKFFKTQTGMRPMEYLTYLRVNRAAKLLRTGNYTVLEAALESGFQHVSYFSKCFKVHMKLTPSEYKNCYSAGH